MQGDRNTHMIPYMELWAAGEEHYHLINGTIDA